MPGMVTPSDVYGFMLRSRTVKEKVIARCQLIDHYGAVSQFRKKPARAMEKILKKLTKKTAVAITDEGFITITVEDKSAEKSAEIANSYVDALNSVSLAINMSQGRKAREFIEARLSSESRILSAVEDSLRSFQERNKTVSLPYEMQAAIRIASQLEARSIAQTSQLELLLMTSTEDNPQIVNLRQQIANDNAELKKLFYGDKKNRLFVPFSKMPETALELGRHTRSVKIHEEVYSLLVQQLEHAKILEAKDTPVVQSLERAYPPTRKNWPKRILMVLLGFFLGCITGIGEVILSIYYREIISHNARFQQVLRILAPLASDLRRLRQRTSKAVRAAD